MSDTLSVEDESLIFDYPLVDRRPIPEELRRSDFQIRLKESLFPSVEL